jgi:hypothetical protein
VLSLAELAGQGRTRGRRTPERLRISLWLAPSVATWWVASQATVIGAVPAGVVLGLVLRLLVVLVVWRRRAGSWDVPLAVGVVIADVPLIALFAGGGLLAATAGVVVAAISVAVVLAAGALLPRRLRLRRQIDASDDALLAAIEIALLDAREVRATSR